MTPASAGTLSPENVIVVVLGGGRGTRLYPLTKKRAKPAVSFGGKYRLIDIPLTNCLRSGFRKVFILTQFNSYSLNRHIWQTYSRQAPQDSFIDVIAAEQTTDSGDWFQGTADAVRQSAAHILYYRPKYILVISGDQIYSMDFQQMFRYHVEHGADITIAGHYTPESQVGRFGVMKLDGERRVVDFHEKPKSPELVAPFRITPRHFADAPVDKPYLCSMGIYLFSTQALIDGLKTKETDFGHGVIPKLAMTHRMFAFPFDGYWEDVGTIQTFYEANMHWREGKGIAAMFEEGNVIITHSRQLPPSRLDGVHVRDSLIADGCHLRAREIDRCIVGVRTRIGKDAVVEDSIIMGNDDYSPEIPFEIGRDCRIRRAIIDKNVIIGDGTVIENRQGVQELDTDLYSVHSGIVIIPRETVIPPGTII